MKGLHGQRESYHEKLGPVEKPHNFKHNWILVENKGSHEEASPREAITESEEDVIKEEEKKEKEKQRKAKQRACLEA